MRNKTKTKTKKNTKKNTKAVRRRSHGISRSLDPRKIKPRGKSGRPRTFVTHPKLKSIVMNLARAGLSQHIIAELCEVSEDTLTREKARDKEFADALDTGRANAIAYSLLKLIQNVKAGNQRAIEYHLNNALGWGDRQFLENAHGGRVELTYNVDPSKILKGIAERGGSEDEQADEG